MKELQQILTTFDDWLWGNWLLFVLLGVGLLYTIITGGIQIRRFGYIIRKTIWEPILSKSKESKEAGTISSFQALCTAVASCVGSGNIVGVSTAVLAGGMGAIFWMWVSAFFGMSTIYAEATLAQNFKTEVNGEVTGGPVYYIKAAFKGTLGKVLAGLFAIFIVLALGFMGNMVQANSIGAAFTEAFGAFNITISPVVIGVIVAAVAAFVFLGGTQRLASVVEKVVPIMAGVYIVGSLILIIMNIANLPAAIKMIFVGAFDPQAVLGAGAGIAVKEAIRFGVARGLFSNEAGMGSTPHAHARATAENPHKQGLCAMISVFIDTFVILNLTVFSVLTTGALESGKNGTALTQAAFMRGFGTFGIVFVAICLLFFAFSTILGWHFFGLINAKYLFGDGAAKIYSLLVVVCIIIGSALKLELVWDLADFFNGLMVIPNAMALLALSGLVVKICNKYSDK